MYQQQIPIRVRFDEYGKLLSFQNAKTPKFTTSFHNSIPTDNQNIFPYSTNKVSMVNLDNKNQRDNRQLLNRYNGQNNNNQNTQLSNSNQYINNEQNSQYISINYPRNNDQNVTYFQNTMQNNNQVISPKPIARSYPQPTSSRRVDYNGINRNSNKTLLEQLVNQNKQIQVKNQKIQQLLQQQQNKNKQISTLNSIIKSFYTKGRPLQSELAKKIFDGSYPTLVQQANAMRRELAQRNKQLTILKNKKQIEQNQLKQYKSRVTHYHNRITDLQYQLSQQYSRINPVYQPITKPAIEPVITSVPEPVIKPVPKPIFERAPKPIIQRVYEAIVERAPQPIIERVTQPTIERVTEPINERVTQPTIANSEKQRLKLQQQNEQLKNTIMTNESRNKMVIEENNRLQEIVDEKQLISMVLSTVDKQYNQDQEKRKFNQMEIIQDKLNKLREQSMRIQQDKDNKINQKNLPKITMLDQQQKNPQQLRGGVMSYQPTKNPMIKKDNFSTFDRTSYQNQSNKSPWLDLSSKISNLIRENDSLRQQLYFD